MRAACAFLAAALLSQAAVRLPQYTRHVLPNGIILDIIPRADVPLVTIHARVRGGIESEQKDLSGIASVTADALRRGTDSRTAEQFSQDLDELGASYSAGVDYQSSRIEIELLAKDFDKGLALLVDALANPAFPPDEVKKLVAQRVDAAKALKDNPDAAASAYFRNFFFGADHPYGRPADATTLARIDREKIAAYHKDLYTGRNMILVVAGDVDPSRVAEAVRKAFAPVPAGQQYQWKKAAVPAPQQTQLAIVDKPDATQTQLLIGLPGIERTSPDRTPLWLVNTLFGGRFTSILNDELRVNTGLTYGASSSFDRAQLPGRITISTFTATENTGRAVDTAVSLLKKFGSGAITAEQLASAKAYIKGTYPSEALETPDQIAAVVADIELFNLNRGEVDDLFSRIDAVTLEKANEVARRYYGGANLKMLLLGNAAKFAGDMKKYDEQPQTVSINTPGLRVTE